MKLPAKLAILASALPLSALAATSHPLTANVYQELLRDRGTALAAEGLSHEDAALGTAGLLRELLAQPTSPYSEVVETPSFTNMIWWPDFAERVGRGQPWEAVISTLQWQQGLTKARPGIDLDISPTQEEAYRGRNAAASAVKAGISAEVFAKALNRHTTRPILAAKEAVAIELLGERMAATPRDRWEANALRDDIYARYTQPDDPAPQMDDQDIDYLTHLLALSLSRGDMSMRDGIQQLPTAYRVARLAAAYRDATGYISDRPICDGNRPAPGVPTVDEAFSEDPRMCFIAATDRGVLGWYRHEVRREHERLRERARRNENHHDKTGLLTLLGIVIPLMDLAAFVEFAEVAVVNELAEASLGPGAIDELEDAAATKTSRLTCGVRAR